MSDYYHEFLPIYRESKGVDIFVAIPAVDILDTFPAYFAEILGDCRGMGKFAHGRFYLLRDGGAHAILF